MSKSHPIFFDTNKVYMLPMVPKTIPMRMALKNQEERVACNIEYDEKGHSYKVSAPGYHSKWFYEDLFKWYIDTGYVTVIE